MPQYKFTSVVSIPEDSEGGFNSRITGTVDNAPFVVDVWCEHDGRDVDFEHVSGHDVREDMDFFDALCEHKPYTDALNVDYKRWEATLDNS